MNTKLSRTYLACCLAILAMMIAAGDTPAQILYSEDFTTSDNKNPATTSALWDDVAGTLTLHPFQGVLDGSHVTTDLPWTVTVAGTWAFLSQSARMEIVDIKDPSSPTSAGYFDLLGDPAYMTVSGNWLIAALSTAGVEIVDISDPAVPVHVGIYATAVNAQRAAVDGDMLYVADYGAGLRIVDISNPASPVEMALHTPSPASVGGVDVKGNYAFIVGQSYGLEVVDITDPALPVPVTTLPMPSLFATDVVIAGNYAYVGNDVGGLQIVDISDPASPTIIGSYTTAGAANSIVVDGDYVHVANNSSGGLEIIDVSSPATPTLAASYGTARYTDVALFGEHTLAIEYGFGLRVIRNTWRVRPPVNVGAFADMGTRVNKVTLDGDYAYAATSGGIRVLDISDPTNPILVETFDPSGGQNWLDIAIDGNYAYAVDGNGTRMRILDISNPTALSFVADYTDVNMTGLYDVVIVGGYAYVAEHSNGVHTVDISTPENPLQVNISGAPDFPNAIAVAGDYLYVADSIYGFAIFDISTPASPFLVTTDPAPVSAWGIAVAGSYAYVADWDHGMWIYDISNPSAPTVVGDLLTVTGRGYDLVVRGSAVFLTDNNGIAVVDVSNPALPIAYDHHSIPGDTRGVAVAGDFGYIGTISGTMQIVQVYEREYNINDRVAESINVNATAGEVSRVRVNTAQTGTILWEVSANGGADWIYANPGDGWVGIPGGMGGADLRWRATAYYNIYGVIPSCQTYELEYELADDDADGVPNLVDACTIENSSYFDYDGDGCVDGMASGRHVEYWAEGDTVTYFINEDGIVGIGDGSDFAAIHDGILSWRDIGGASIPVGGGTTTQDTARILDQVNLVTNSDDEYDFGQHTLAVGIATSFTTPTYFNGKLYRPGQIVDADMIFNPDKSFKTATAGSGTDLNGVAKHEGGHLFGLSHSAIRTSTMFYALPPGTEAQTLETDDITAFQRAYPSLSFLASANHLWGTVQDGVTGDPVPGVLVYAVNVATGDTSACDVTTPLGGYYFLGLPDAEYYLSIHGIDQTSPVWYMEPKYFNWLCDSLAVTNIVPEFWDVAESVSDNPQDKTAIDMAPINSFVADFFTNVDQDGPNVVATYPTSGEPDVSAHASILVKFDEGIDYTTVTGNFKVFNNATLGYVDGVAYVMDDDSLISFRPFTPFDYSTSYPCTVGAGIEDKHGNPLGTEYAFSFTTEVAPPLGINEIVPDQGATGAVVVINGNSFSSVPSSNTVLFDDPSGSYAGTVLAASPTQLSVAVPDGDVGPVSILVTVGVSGPVTHPFTRLPSDEIVRGYEVGNVHLGALPRAVVLSPDGGTAYVATDAGVSAVGVDPGLPGFLSKIDIPIAGGTDDLDITPDGNWVYAVAGEDSTINVIDAALNAVVATLHASAEPLGICVEPGGNRLLVPADDGDVQVWNVQPGTPGYRAQVAAMSPPEPSLNGKLAVDPAAGRLLALSGNGKLMAFDLGPDTFLVDVTLNPAPRDVVVSPTGQHAYVSDDGGRVTIVNLAGMFKVIDITAGGSLRGMAMTPAGKHLFAANRELNTLDVIDLNDQSASYRTVAATIAQGVNPVDVALTSDGAYAVSIVEDAQQLVVTAVGVGPTLESVMPSAAITGATVVLAGSGFGTDLDSLTVNFAQVGGGTIGVQPDRSTGSAVTVKVPPGATSGAVTVSRDRSTHVESSNSKYFELITVPVQPPDMQWAATVPLTSSGPNNGVAVSPLGDQVAVGVLGGEVIFVVIDPDDGDYLQTFTAAGFTTAPIYDVTFSPDGKRLYASATGDPTVYSIDADRSSDTYGSDVQSLDFSIFPGESLWELAVSPDGTCLLTNNTVYNSIAYVDLVKGSPTENVATSIISMPNVRDIRFHPGGEYAYCAEININSIRVIDMNPASPSFFQVVEGDSNTYHPVSLDFSADGSTCLVLARHGSTSNPYILTYDTSNPRVPAFVSENVVGTSTTSASVFGDRIEIAPTDHQAVIHANDDGLIQSDLTIPGFPPLMTYGGTPFLENTDFGFSPDRSGVYAVSTASDTMYVFNFVRSDTIFAVSGDGQTGVAGQALAAPLRVRVVGPGSVPAPGKPITFQVTGGGGIFLGSNLWTQTVATDQNGYAEVHWQLGPAFSLQTVQASGSGMSLVGEPVTFTATAIADPATQPIELVSVSPVDAALDVGVTTTILADFSRSVDSTTVSTSSFFFHTTGDPTPVAATVGFTNDLKRVSLTPVSSLDYNTDYEIEILAAIQDDAANPLQDPDTVAFRTELPPPPSLSAIDPPSATEAVVVTLSGSGFNSDFAQNEVLFGGVSAVPLAGGVDHLNVEVPVAAATGVVNVAVVANGDTSNALPFTILVPTNTAADQVVASVATGKGVKAVTMSPDGSMAYAVSPAGNVVVPIDIENHLSLPPIPVGIYPFSIDMHPSGDYAYVANYNSGDISIIDTDSLSIGYHTVDSTIVVGGHPIDLVVTSDGDRVYVVKAPPEAINLDVIDSDDLSANWHTVIASAAVANGPKSVTVSPDGTRLYFGTSDGYVVINAGDESYSLIASVSSGKGTKTITISPDGTLLFVLTTLGDVVIYYVEPGSPSENDVVATVSTAKGTKTITISPDGTLLYLIQEESDIILVIELVVFGSVAVVDGVPPIQLTTTIIDTVFAGEDPEAMVFSPTDPTLALVSNSGPQTMTFLNSSFVSLEVPPDTMIAPSPMGMIYEVGSFLMNNISNEVFRYEYRVTTEGPAVFAPGLDPEAIAGTTPALAPGEALSPPPAQLEIPAAAAPDVQLVIYTVTTVENPNFVKRDTCTVTLDGLVPVTVATFEAAAVKAGVQLKWDLSPGKQVHGFSVYRRVTGEDVDVPVASGLSTGVRMYVDEDVQPDREYRYTLAVVMEDGSELMAQSTTVRTIPLELALYQNYPNPFNPTTTIVFALPSKEHVKLTIYNVEGKRVVTLIDGPMIPGRKEMVWQGENQKGNPVSSGVYFYRLVAGNKSLTRKMVLIR